MFRPSGSNSEFIEVYNLSASESVDLSGYSIAYYGNNPDFILAHEESALLPPLRFAVILEGDYDFENGVYKNIFPDDALILVIDNNAFGRSGLSNSSDRDVSLISTSGDTLETYFYSANNDEGISDEKIILNKDNSPDNWDNAIQLDGTPGSINSVAPIEFDLAIDSFYSTKEFGLIGEEIELQGIVKNFGTEKVDEYSLFIYFDENGDTIFSESEIINELSGDMILSGDSAEFTINVNSLIEGQNLFYAEVEFSFDQRAENNGAVLEMMGVAINEERGDLIVNEFMYDPIEPDCEWIELFNRSNKIIEFHGYEIADSKDTVRITDEFYQIEPGEFIVITHDSLLIDSYNISAKTFVTSFPVLNNSGDIILITDSLHRVIDSLTYTSSWGGADGISLERISSDNSSCDPSNWTSSMDPRGCTPGRINSVAQLEEYISGEVIVNEIMFDPSNENSEFVELYNTTNYVIQLGGWTFEDESGNIYSISKKMFLLGAGKYFVFAADSTIFNNYNWLTNNEDVIVSVDGVFSLANTGEKIKIADGFGNVIDSVDYSDEWHNQNIYETKNKSLERLNYLIDSNDPSNWSTSVSPHGATPAEKNSIHTEYISDNSKVLISPNPFSPDNDGFEDFTIISYSLTQPIAQMRIKIYDSKGRLVRNIYSNQPGGSSGSVIFDGLNDSGNPLKIGIYILFIEALNDQSGIVETIKEAIVVARRL